MSDSVAWCPVIVIEFLSVWSFYFLLFNDLVIGFAIKLLPNQQKFQKRMQKYYKNCANIRKKNM